MNAGKREAQRIRNSGRTRLLSLAKDADVRSQLRKLESKLYNCTYYYLQVHSGEFKQIYDQHINNAIAVLQKEHGAGTYLDALKAGKVTPRDLRVHPDIVVKPSFDPRCTAVACITSALKEWNDPILFTKVDPAEIESVMFEKVAAYCRAGGHVYQVRWDNKLFFERYNDRLSIILGHLIPDSITNKLHGNVVINKIKAGLLTSKDIGTMEDVELCPQAILKEKNEIETRGQQRINEKYSTLFRCPTCKEKRSIAREVQTRSLDEAADFFCVCCNCNTSFKGRS